jgi:hypothetical protein
VTGDGDSVLFITLRVLREYLEDCDSDIEGCTGPELTEIEHAMDATRTIRHRIVDAVAAKHGDQRHVEAEEERTASPLLRYSFPAKKEGT